MFNKPKRGKILGELMIKTKKSQLRFYRKIPLFIERNSQYVLYKEGGVLLSDMRIDEDAVPKEFYIRAKDKIRGLMEAQKGMNKDLSTFIKRNEPTRVKEVLIDLMTETFEEPRGCALENIRETMNIVADEYSKDSSIIEKLADIAVKDYTTMAHSVNLMALCLGYGKHTKMTIEEIKQLGLAALLHDIGKTKISDDVLKASRQLSAEEFNEIKKHPIYGYRILKDANFEQVIRLVALEHHEKMDKSGYPQGIIPTTKESKIVGVIDCYEALTGDDRPYRQAMMPLLALKIIKSEAKDGKLDDKVFKNFIYSLV